MFGKYLVLIGLQLACLMPLTGCDGYKSGNGSRQRAKEAAASTVNYALQEQNRFSITQITEPDSVMGDVLITEDEVGVIYGNLKDVSKVILTKSDNLTRVDNSDLYLIGLANLHLQADNNMRMLMCKPTFSDTFTGWKVRVFFERPLLTGDTLRVMRYCYITPDGNSVVKVFDSPVL